MRLHLIFLFIPFAAAQLPFNIVNAWTAFQEVAKLETQCFKDIKQSAADLFMAALTAKDCRTLECLRSDMITNATYPLKMLASTGRPHSFDLDELSLTWAGDPKLCKHIDGPFNTNYCFVHVNIDWSQIDIESFGMDLSYLPGGVPHFEPESDDVDRCGALLSFNFKLALCMPSSCAQDTNIARILSLITNGTAHMCEINCVGPKKEPNTGFYLFNAIIVSLAVLAVISSIVEFIATSTGREAEFNTKTGWRLLASFSILRNTSEIFSVRRKSDSILCLGAIRFITLTWVVNGHSVIFTGDGDNGLQLIRESDYFFSDVLLNPYASVDTFFLVSGLLVSYSFFKACPSNVRVHSNPEFVYAPLTWIMYYVHRWLRLTPSYLLFIWLFVAWTPRMHDVWATGTTQNLTRFVENCENYWWLNALYINNFRSVLDICYPVSWFLSVDTQLYWAAPVFLIAIYHSLQFITGIGAIIGGVLLSFGANAFLTAYYDLPAIGNTANSPPNIGYMTHLYIKPWIRCVPYLTGIVCGYCIVQVRKHTVKIRLPKAWQLSLCWFVATTCALVVIFAVYDYLRGHSEWSIATRVLYTSFARIGWSAAVAWVILVCTLNWAGPVKALLEHPLWYPLGRLSYCAFLAHWFMLQVLGNQSDRPPHFVSLWHTYLTVTISVIFLSYAMAFIWSCLVEIPFAKIEIIAVELLIERRGQMENEMANATRSKSKTKDEKQPNAMFVSIVEVGNHD